MRKLLFALPLLLIFGCKSTSKLIEQGDYDKAIDKTIKKMLKGNADNQEKQMLDKAYKLANQSDKERIKLLKTEGNPQNWEQIYYTLQRLDNRQKNVRKVLPYSTGNKVYNYKQIDYSSEIVEAKTKAADYFYNLGQQKMSLDIKTEYRSAYSAFQKARKYRADLFPEIDSLIHDAKYLGTTRVLIEAYNKTNLDLPNEFYDELLRFDISSFENFWTQYYLYSPPDRMDYVISIAISNYVVSPEQYRTKEVIREKTIPDGFRYVLDANGNVKKDSTGNDIKVAKHKIIKCRLITREQSKEATLEATVKFFNPTMHRMLKMEKIGGTSVFSHASGKALGNIEALLPEDHELIRTDPEIFPDDYMMLFDCIHPLNQAITDFIRNNRGLLE